MALALATLGLAGCGPAESSPTPPPGPTAEAAPALTVAMAEVVRREMARTITATGSVVAWQELAIGAEASGLRIAEVLVEEGDTVRQGQILVRLNDAILQAQLAQNAAAIAEAEANLHLAQADLRRVQDLARSDTASRQTLDQRQAAARAAEARLVSARALRGEIEAKLAQTRILSPADGIVSRRAALPGSVVSPGTELVRLIRDRRIELDAQVPELDLAAIKAGQSVRVVHGERSMAASVRAVAPIVAADSRLGLVHVALPADAALRPGMYARAEIQVGAAQVLAVPEEAVSYRDGRPAVFVLQSGNRAALRPILAGARREGWVEVAEGLTVGEPVVVTGAGFLSDGDRVRVDVPKSPSAP